MEDTKHLWIQLCGDKHPPSLDNCLGNDCEAGHGESECTGKQSQLYATSFLDV